VPQRLRGYLIKKEKPDVPAFNKFEIGLVHNGFGLKLGFSELDHGFLWMLDSSSGSWI
jgi:hypothetical protein